MDAYSENHLDICWIALENTERQHYLLMQKTVMHYQIRAQSINQSINQSIDQSIDQSINQSINRSINRSIDQSIDQFISLQ